MSHFRVIAFNVLAIIFFLITAYMLIQHPQWPSATQGGVAMLAAGMCLVIGNLDSFDSFKASATGLEAKVRKAQTVAEDAKAVADHVRNLVGASSNPEVELKIVNEVGSYGRQLGLIEGALEVLMSHYDVRNLSATERAAFEAAKLKIVEINMVKRRALAEAKSSAT